MTLGKQPIKHFGPSHPQPLSRVGERGADSFDEFRLFHRVLCQGKRLRKPSLPCTREDMPLTARSPTPRNDRLPSNQRGEGNTPNVACYCQKDHLRELVSPGHAVVLARHEFMMQPCLF